MFQYREHLMKKIGMRLTFVAMVLALMSCEQRPVTSEKLIASGYQKPGADVRLFGSRVFLAEVSDTLSVSVLLQAGHPLGFLSVHLSPNDGFDILQGKLSQTIALDGSYTYEIPIVLYARQKGKHYLPISAIVELPNGQKMQRSLSLIVQVGKEASLRKQKDSSTKLDDNGRLIKSLPAVEDIR